MIGDIGQLQWLGRTWQFESNARAHQALHQMVQEGIAPQEYPEWGWLYPLCIQYDRRYHQCLHPHLGACFHPGRDRRTVCYVEHQLTLELKLYAQLPMPFLATIRPLQKPFALKRLGRERTLKLLNGRRRKAKVHKFKSRTPAHVKTYRMPLCCMEMARLAPRPLQADRAGRSQRTLDSSHRGYPGLCEVLDQYPTLPIKLTSCSLQALGVGVRGKADRCGLT